MVEDRLFEPFAENYDDFFIERPDIYQSELAAIKSLGLRGRGVDIGVGTGILSHSLGEMVGVDVARGMLDQACRRGIECLQASAHALPLRSGTFDFALMSTTICFLRRPEVALVEAARVLRQDGRLAVCVITRDSSWGRAYREKGGKGHPLYSHARFFNLDEIIGLLGRTGFEVELIVSTLHKRADEAPGTVEPVSRDDRGSYVCVLSRKV